MYFNMKWLKGGMHSECGHTVHSHLNDESLVTYLPTDSPKTGT